MTSPAPLAPADDRSSERAASTGRIPRWVGVVLPAAVLGGVGLAVMFAVNRSWLDVVVVLGGAAALGLLSGFVARRTMRERSSAVRWTVALGALTVGLCVAGLLSEGNVGLRPLLPLVPFFRWGELAQLAVGAAAAWLAVRAFSRRRVSLPHEPAVDAGPPAWGFTYQPAASDTQPVHTRRGRRPAPDLRPVPSTSEAAWRQYLRRLRTRLARAAAWRPMLGLRPSRAAQGPIRFTGSGEDRCPYCLDIVAENDPRGVTTCPICHTRHHAECWAVTGTCQMPHLYEGRTSARTGAAR
jgi:hypothetical protein